MAWAESELSTAPAVGAAQVTPALCVGLPIGLPYIKQRLGLCLWLVLTASDGVERAVENPCSAAYLRGDP